MLLPLLGEAAAGRVEGQGRGRLSGAVDARQGPVEPGSGVVVGDVFLEEAIDGPCDRVDQLGVGSICRMEASTIASKVPWMRSRTKAGKSTSRTNALSASAIAKRPLSTSIPSGP